jgi:hypothetical protein
MKQTPGEWALSVKAQEESLEELIARVNEERFYENSEKQKQVPIQVDLKKVRELVSDKEAFDVLDSNIWILTIDAVKNNDFQAVASNIKAMVAGQLITKESAAKLSTALKATQLDPSYQKQIYTSLSAQAGYEKINLEDFN